jgi:hypothetical protein
MLTLTIPRRLTVDVADFAAASAAYAQCRDLSGKGAGAFPEGAVTEGDRTIARVSYNGRVWALDADKPRGGGTLAYCPASAGQDEGHPDVFNEGREACWGKPKENQYPTDSAEWRAFDAGFKFAASFNI